MAGVVKRVPVAGILAGPKHFETVIMLGIDPAAEKKNTAFWKKTVQGSFLSGDSPGVFISRTLADELAVGAGDTLRFSPGDMEHFRPFTVEGVYATGIEQLDRGMAFCSLAVHPDPQRPWTASVFLKDGVDPDEVLAAYRKQPA